MPHPRPPANPPPSQCRWTAEWCWADPLIRQLFFRQLGMGGAGRMNDQRFHIRHIGQQRKNRKMINELAGSIGGSSDLKSKDGSAPTGKIFLVQLMAGFSGQRQVMYRFHLGMLGQILHNPQGIAHMTLHPQRECFQTLKKQKRMEGRQRRPRISE